jgi:sn-glycerol 3-phosphate transport system substrate-binding protein
MNTRFVKQALIGALGLLMAFGSGAALAQQPVEIVYWRSLGGVLGETQEELVRQFNASQDEVVVDAQFQGNYEEIQRKYLAALAANDLPDVLLMAGSRSLMFARDGVLEPLDRFIDAPDGLDRSDFIESLVSRGEHEGQQFMMPFAASTPMLYYNPDMLEAAGFSGPPETWDELFTMAREIHEHFDGQVLGFALDGHMGDNSWWLQSHIWSYGGDISEEDFTPHVDSDVIVDVLGQWRELIHVDGAARLVPQAEGGARSAYVNGRAAMIIASTANITTFKAETAGRFEPLAGYVPRGPEGQFIAAGASGLIMPVGLPPERQEAAWKFIRFMTSPESNAYFAERTGYLPYTHAAVENMQDFLAENPLWLVSADQLEFGRHGTKLQEASEAWSHWLDALERVLVGNQDPNTVLPRAQQEILVALRTVDRVLD